MLTLWQRHLVGVDVVKGAVAADVRDVYAALVDDLLGRLVGLPLGHVVLVVAPVARHVVRLFDVEHGVDADHRRAGLFRLGRARLLLLVVKLVKQHVRGLLACANLPAHVVDLLVGGPAVIAVALRRLGDTEVDRIAAPIRRAGLDVCRAAARAGRPRRHALLDLRLAGRGERGVVVVQVPPGPGCLRRRFMPPGHALPPFQRDGLSARGVWNVLLSRRRDRGSRRVQRHVVRVPHHGRRLTAVKAGHACRADQTLDRTRVARTTRPRSAASLTVQRAPIQEARTCSPCSRNWPCGPTYR